MKIEILDRLSKGERSTTIGKLFNLGESTIRGIKNNEAAIRKSAILGTKLNSKLSRYSRNDLLEKMERALLIWFEELSQKKVPLSGYLIQRKALQYYEKMRQLEPSTSSQIEKSFSASKGWLVGFLKRNSLHNVKITGEVASANTEGAKDFPEKLAIIIEDGGYLPDQVFNADETGLFWKKMPDRTYIAKSEKKASGFKASKDRITLLLCSNASGDRILKPLVINRFLRPRALKGKDIQQLPVHWMANSKAWVTAAIFNDWFNNCFVPEIEKYMKQKGLDFKALLVVDNAPGHMHLEHPNVKVIFLPPNTTSLIQPLDQGIISTFKKYFIKQTFEFILDKLQNKSITLIEAWKQFSIFDCINHIALSVTQIKPSTLNACWKNAWPECLQNGGAIQTSQLSNQIITLAQNIGGEGFDTFNENDIGELLIDEPLNDDDVIAISLEPVENAESTQNDDNPEIESRSLTAKIIQEGLLLCDKLENHFLTYDPNSERAFKFQRELQRIMTGYRELRKELTKGLSQKSITDYLVVKQTLPNDETEIDSTVNVSSSDEKDIQPVRKRARILSEKKKNE